MRQDRGIYSQRASIMQVRGSIGDTPQLGRDELPVELVVTAVEGFLQPIAHIVPLEIRKHRYPDPAASGPLEFHRPLVKIYFEKHICRRVIFNLGEAVAELAAFGG